MISGVPYDAEIEYLESTGTQWIDTGILPNQDTGAEISFSVSFTGGLGVSGREIFGAGSNNRYFELLLDPSKYYYYQYGASTPKLELAVDNIDHYELWYANKNKLYNLYTGEVISSAPEQTFTITNTLFLFGLNNGSPVRLLIGRIKYCKLYQDGVLVRDLIPVRVGQTGYMYDRVSKRLFGNQGTGSFGLGPDVAKPVIGLYGMRQITYVPSDYVTDGIVAWYDGEWNAGWNKHDANAQTWKDLSGEGNDATIVKSDTFDRSFTFDSNSCTMDGTFCWSFTASDSVINAVKGDCTIEVIRKLGTPSIQDSTPFFGLNVYNSRAMSMAGAPNNMKFRMGMSNEFQTGNSTIPGISTTITKHIEGTAISNGFYEKGVQRGTGTYNTQAITVNSSGMLFGAGTNLFGGKGRYWEPSPPADGHAYTLRFYNRALSPDEIAHNYAIDKARFNLP